MGPLINPDGAIVAVVVVVALVSVAAFLWIVVIPAALDCRDARRARQHIDPTSVPSCLERDYTPPVIRVRPRADGGWDITVSPATHRGFINLDVHRTTYGDRKRADYIGEQIALRTILDLAAADVRAAQTTVRVYEPPRGKTSP